MGWSLLGNIAGISVVRYIEKNSDKYNTFKNFKKREAMKVAGFFMAVAAFTLYGYGSAKQ